MHIGYIDRECPELIKGVRVKVTQKGRKHNPNKIMIGEIIQRTEETITVHNGTYRESYRIMDLANDKNDYLTYKIVS